MEEAAASYQKVIELGYEGHDLWIDYAKLLHDAGYYKDCELTLADGIQKFPDEAELYYRMCGLQIELGRKKDAMCFLENALELNYDKHVDLFEFIPELAKDLEIISMINSYNKSK